jgi:hypothetical protein
MTIMGSDIIVYFSVNKYGSYTYVHELFTNPKEAPDNQARLIDVICDAGALETELTWDKICKNQRPRKVGLYEAIVQHVQTAEDDFRLDVIDCKPKYTFEGVYVNGSEFENEEEDENSESYFR